jgi:hypothetical protein
VRERAQRRLTRSRRRTRSSRPSCPA